MKNLKNSENKIKVLKKENLFLKEEIIRISVLIIQKVKESKQVRNRLEKALLENERKRMELEKEVRERTEELQEKIEELEKFNKLAVGRELKMVQLKEQIKKLKEEYAQK